jgi:hypothetical protein
MKINETNLGSLTKQKTYRFKTNLGNPGLIPENVLSIPAKPKMPLILSLFIRVHPRLIRLFSQTPQPNPSLARPNHMSLLR